MNLGKLPGMALPANARTGGPDPLSALKAGQVKDADRLRTATDLLESSFVNELYKAMRETVPDDGLMSGGTGEAMFGGLMDQHLADVTAAKLRNGIGQALYDQFKDVAGVTDGGGES